MHVHYDLRAPRSGRDMAKIWPAQSPYKLHDQEDDAAFLPHFGEWARWQMARAGDFDFMNLAAIRAWGSESPGVECAQSYYLHATIPDGRYELTHPLARYHTRR